MKRRITNGDEQDAYTRWRHLLVYTGRPGVIKAIKRRTHKRERREGQQEIDAQLELDECSECEDCGMCEGWACRGDATFLPMPVQRPMENDD